MWESEKAAQPGIRGSYPGIVCGVGRALEIDDNTIVLLGAGASVEAGIPDAFEMTDRLSEALAREGGRSAVLGSAFDFVCEVLRRGEAENQGLDIERAFTAIELLAERESLEISPFISAWHPGLGVSRWAPSVFADLAAAILFRLRELVLSPSGASDYLAPLVNLGRRDGGLTIATLNFDLMVEQCAQSRSVSYETGMEGWVVYGVWMWREYGIRLLKLHGSVAEAWDQVEHFDALMPHQTIYEVDDPTVEDQPPVMAFGTREKLQARGPFLGLLAQFEHFLHDAERLVVIGYSFRDHHVNEAIVRWSHFSTGRKLVVVDPAWPEDVTALHQDDFRSILAGHLRPPVDSPRKFEPRLEIRRETCSAALRSIRGSGES